MASAQKNKESYPILKVNDAFYIKYSSKYNRRYGKS